LFPFSFPFRYIAKILNFLIPTNKNGKNFAAKVHFFCIIEYVRATCVPYLKNCVGGCFRTFAPLQPLQHICSQSERRIRRLRRPARRGVFFGLACKSKKKLCVGMCVIWGVSKKKQPTLSIKKVLVAVVRNTYLSI